MAKLERGGQRYRRQRIYRLLKRHPYGLRESEIAQEMGVHRRTANNYLRELKASQKAEKDGWLWFSR